MLRATSLCLFTCMLSVGCQKQPVADTDAERDPARQVSHTGSDSGGVAIVNLDAVANQIGRTAQMTALIAARESELNQQLSMVQQGLRAQYDNQARALNYQPPMTTEEQQQLNAFDRQLGARLQQAQQVARQQLLQYQREVIAHFREETKPYARAVAQERGLSVVMTLDEVHMLAYAPSVDITDAVAERMALGVTTPSSSNATATQPEGNTLR